MSDTTIIVERKLGTIVGTGPQGPAGPPGPVTVPLPVAEGGTGTITGSITGTGELVLAAGGADENVRLTPSGEGHIRLDNQVKHFGAATDESGAGAYYAILSQVDPDYFTSNMEYRFVAYNPSAPTPEFPIYSFGAYASYYDDGSSDFRGFGIFDYAATKIVFNIDQNLRMAFANTSPASLDPASLGTFVIGPSESPPTTAPADHVQYWAADINGAAGKCGLHMMAESGTNKLVVAGVIIKTDTGDPSQVHEGLMCINTFDNNLKMYADGGWRTLASW